MISDTKLQDLVLSVQNAIPKEVKLIHLALTGSRGKNMFCSESDYDIKGIIINKKDDYLLQRIHKKYVVNSEFDGKVLKGNLVDITTIYEYAQETNLYILDMIEAPILYTESTIFQEIREIYLECYNLFMPFHAYDGRLQSFMKNSLKNKEGKYLKECNIKVLADAIHCVLQLRSIFAGDDSDKCFNLDCAMKYSYEEKEEFEAILKKRRENNSGKIELSSNLADVIENTFNMTFKYDESNKLSDYKTNQELINKRKDSKNKANIYLLKTIKKYLNIS